jgi:hypothetical protein
VIGLLLILSILLPTFVQGISSFRGNLNRKTILSVAAFLLIFILFFAFFFWSRAAVIAGV